MPKAKSKAGPKSTKSKAVSSRASPPASSSKKKKSASVNGGGDESRGAFLDDVGSDEEESFSSVGPYQCEICQAITELKEDFVYHIKSYHSDIVDAEVLKSLDRDIMIRKKKQMNGN